MNGDIVPSWYFLFLVPRGGYVGMWTVENTEYRLVPLKTLPLRIGLGHMAREYIFSVLIRFQLQRNMGCPWFCVQLTDHNSKTMLANERHYLRSIFVFLMMWDVHKIILKWNKKLVNTLKVA